MGLFCAFVPRVISSKSAIMLVTVLQLLLVWLGSSGGEMVPENEQKVDDFYDNFRKLGDTCLSDHDCQSIRDGICDELLRKCVCKDSHPVEVMGTICYEAVALNHSCVSDSQCEYLVPHSHCTRSSCQCEDGFLVRLSSNGTALCKPGKRKVEPEVFVDYTMLGVLAGMALMFIVMCVVLRMFSKARFQENRTIFNSPRLLKISLARKSQEQRDNERRGSRCSAPSRQPSVYSGLNVPGKSPNGSQGSGGGRSAAGSRRGSMVQSPLDDRKPSRAVDQVTVDVRGVRDHSSHRANQV